MRIFLLPAHAPVIYFCSPLKALNFPHTRLRGSSPDAERRHSAAGRGGELGRGVRFGARAVRPSLHLGWKLPALGAGAGPAPLHRDGRRHRLHTQRRLLRSGGEEFLHHHRWG